MECDIFCIKPWEFLSLWVKEKKFYFGVWVGVDKNQVVLVDSNQITQFTVIKIKQVYPHLPSKLSHPPHYKQLTEHS